MKITKESFEKALKGSGSIISVIADRLKVSRGTVYIFINNNPFAKEALLNERESMIDLAEAQLLNKLNSGTDWAIKYALGTLGRGRGWAESPHVQVIDKQNNLTIQVSIPEEVKKLLEAENE